MIPPKFGEWKRWLKDSWRRRPRLVKCHFCLTRFWSYGYTVGHPVCSKECAERNVRKYLTWSGGDYERRFGEYPVLRDERTTASK